MKRTSGPTNGYDAFAGLHCGGGAQTRDLSLARAWTKSRPVVLISSTSSAITGGRVTASRSLLPDLMGTVNAAGLALPQSVDAMAAIGYSKESLHQLERWESKRTTGAFGR